MIVTAVATLGLLELAGQPCAEAALLVPAEAASDGDGDGTASTTCGPAAVAKTLHIMAEPPPFLSTRRRQPMLMSMTARPRSHRAALHISFEAFAGICTASARSRGAGFEAFLALPLPRARARPTSSGGHQPDAAELTHGTIANGTARSRRAARVAQREGSGWVRGVEWLDGGFGLAGDGLGERGEVCRFSLAQAASR